jgi:starch synthase
LTVYLIRCPELYDRPSIYSGDNDDAYRFAFLSRAAIECCQRMGWGPHVFHCHDWHTALLPLYLRTIYGWDSLFQSSRTLLTIHNIAYQGVFPASILGDLELAEHSDRFHQEDLAAGVVNFFKTGILYADGLSTVSPTYAREIQEGEYGMGLQNLLRARRDHLVGILNGVDYNEWNPGSDRFIAAPYSALDPSGKRRNKQVLLESLSLAPGTDAPIFGVVSRLTSQKGFDLMFEPLPEMLAATDARLVALGSGEARYEEFFNSLQHRFPGRVCFYRGYNTELSHLIEAGADIFLMPSRFEPCGLNQMYSLKYGTPPLVRRTGGLADSVELFNPLSGEGTGFVFDQFSVDAFRWALSYALETYRDPPSWRQLMQNGMRQDFSWERQGAIYQELYRRLATLMR